MPSHNARYDMADADVTRVSNTDGELLGDIDEWGAEYQLESAGAETRTLAPPSWPGQRVALVMTVDGGDVVVAAPSGQTFNGTGDEATFADVGDLLVLESYTVAPGTVEWRVALNIGSVAIA